MNTTGFKTVPAASKAWAENRILSLASENQLKAVQIEVGGYALRWEELDEDLTVSGIIAGQFQLPLPRIAA